MPIAWGGALVFLVSLLWAAYAYLYRFSLPGSPGSRIAAITSDVSLFLLFALHHSLLARSGAKTFMRRLVGAELERSLYTWTASVLFIVACASWQPVAGSLYRLEWPWRGAAFGIQLVGVLLTIRSSAALDVLDLAGVRDVERARSGRAPQHVALATTGLYGFVRHPLYFAWALMVWGSPDMTATRATFAAVTTAYLALAIPWEERSLIRAFGRDYERYRLKVRWRMFPGLY
jgi:protein-S-isoprenylcysteine O-methyltransferase Ste14